MPVMRRIGPHAARGSQGALPPSSIPRTGAAAPLRRATRGRWRSLNLVAKQVQAATPSNTVMMFALADCPSGWADYEAAHERFPRAIDPNEPQPRRPGSVQEDSLKGHSHTVQGFLSDIEQGPPNNVGAMYGDTRGIRPSLQKTWTPGTETRPKNVALRFCIKRARPQSASTSTDPDS